MTPDTLVRLADVYGDARLQRDVALMLRETEARTVSVAFLGQFKRGKSTLLNTLLGEELLPTGRLPVTGIATHIHHGRTRELVIHFLDGREIDADLGDLASYVTEEQNALNRLGVWYADITLPNPLLHNMLLIDTPGVGSVYEHNTSVAHEISGRTDLAVFVTGPEPPITSDELAFLARVREHAEHTIVVVSKIDMAHEFESEVLAFTANAVSPTPSDSLEIYPLDGKRRDERFTRFWNAVSRFTEDGVLGQRSRQRRLARVASEIRHRLALRRAAALLPLDERRRAHEAFAELADVISERGSDLIRAIEHFPNEELISVDVLLGSLREEAKDTVENEVESFVELGAEAGERRLRERVAEYEATWSRRIGSSLQLRIEKRRRSTIKLLNELENRYLEAAHAALGLEQPHDVIELDHAFGEREAATRMTEPMPTTGLEIIAHGMIGALPAPIKKIALRKRFRTLGRELLDRSSGRVRSAAMRHLLEWRIANVGLIRERLSGARAAVDAAFSDAAQKPDDIAGDVSAFDRDERLLEALLSAHAS